MDLYREENTKIIVTENEINITKTEDNVHSN